MKLSRAFDLTLRMSLLLGLLGFGPGAQAKDWALAGTVVTPDQVIADGAVSISGQTISALGTRAQLPAKQSVEKVDGIIIPGLIDLHDHLSWNDLPRWVPNHKFANRYEWQDTAEYDRLLVAPHSVALNGAACESEMFAEVKALIGGATSVVGSLMPDPSHPDNLACAQGLARNLDVASDLGYARQGPNDPCEAAFKGMQPPLDFVDYEVFPLEVAHDRVGFLQCELKSGGVSAVIAHLAEGATTDASARREFRMLSASGLIQPGLVVVHGTALHAEDFQMMAGKAGLVWSPRSNDELYGSSTNIAAALQQNVAVAIAPDWSPTGSAGMLQEIGYAARRYKNVTAPQLLAMGTAVAAKIARLDDRIGSLAPNHYADLVVIRGDRANPYQSVVQASPADIMLVVVGGQPLYGDPALLARLLPGVHLETFPVCGSAKAIYLGNSAAAGRHETFADIQNLLNAALEKGSSGLAPLECE